MLLRFSAENIRSLRDPQELTLVASKFYKERQEALLSDEALPDVRLLPCAVIYGPNASGKSNVIRAARFLQASVQDSHPRGSPKGGVWRKPFALDPQSKSRPSAVEIEFVSAGTRYHYGFEASDEQFSSEWLFSFPRGRRQLLFERTSGKEINFGRSLKGQNRVIADLMRPNSLFLSAAAQNDHEQLSPVYSYINFMQFYSGIQAVPMTVDRLLEGETVDPRIVSFLTRTGTGVVSARKQKSSRRWALSFRINEAGERVPVPPRFEIELGHQTAKEVVYLKLEDESAGTRRLLLVLARAFKALETGSVFFLDELDASLHTQVGEAIFALFANRDTNRRGAQIVATTHDTNLMRSEYLRRDQIWFTEKDQTGATHLYPLSDIRTRNTDNIERGYLQGRYGAVPFAGSVEEIFIGS